MSLRAAVLASTIVFTVASTAHADQSTIRTPSLHDDYFLEVEPHFLVSPLNKPAAGAGLRLSFEILDPGFVRTINDSIAIGVGVDVSKKLAVPIVLQWNFWFTQNWSAFAEVGGGVGDGLGKPFPEPHAAAGGRFRLTQGITLTGRAGFPGASFGVSFLL